MGLMGEAEDESEETTDEGSAVGMWSWGVSMVAPLFIAHGVCRWQGHEQGVSPAWWAWHIGGFAVSYGVHFVWKARTPDQDPPSDQARD